MTLVNHGLLRDEDISVRYWDGKEDQPFRPGMALPPTPTPVIVPCTVYQPLGTQGWVMISKSRRMGLSGSPAPVV